VAKSIRRREVITRAAVGATFLIAWPVASQPQQVIYSGGEIVPGGPLRKLIKVRETAQDKRSPHRPVLPPVTPPRISRKATRGTSAG
jgi:hypothetical protein